MLGFEAVIEANQCVSCSVEGLSSPGFHLRLSQNVLNLVLSVVWQLWLTDSLW